MFEIQLGAQACEGEQSMLMMGCCGRSDEESLQQLERHEFGAMFDIMTSSSHTIKLDRYQSCSKVLISNESFGHFTVTRIAFFWNVEILTIGIDPNGEWV
eukprot:scaffold1803_cov92-Amphora_coffeaeformis.AAC.67